MSAVGPVIVSLSGKILLPEERELIKNPKIGGIVLYRENYDNDAENPKESLKKLIKEIRELNRNVLIMIDHEGGKVWRFNKGFTKLPAAKDYGDMYDKDAKTGLDFAYQQGKIMAKELLECDIDMSLAPVVDLDGPSNVIGKLLRGFHKDPKVVTLIAEQFIKGMNDAGMPATIKHFPGHGSTILDSHGAKPVDERSMDELQKDLLPFKELIAKNLVGVVMPAHVTYTAVDPENTAGFSKIWVQGCLRMGCGFKGVVMSDCLLMKGADVGAAIERFTAAQKTCDFLMYTHQHGEHLDKLLSILDKIPDNKTSADRREALRNSIRKPVGLKLESKLQNEGGEGSAILDQYKNSVGGVGGLVKDAAVEEPGEAPEPTNREAASRESASRESTPGEPSPGESSPGVSVTREPGATQTSGTTGPAVFGQRKS